MTKGKGLHRTVALACGRMGFALACTGISLQAGRCLQEENVRVPLYEARLEGDTVLVTLVTRNLTR